MIEGLGNSLKSYWDKWRGRVPPVSRVENEGTNTEEQRESERYSEKKKAEASAYGLQGGTSESDASSETHGDKAKIYGPDGEKHDIDPDANIGRHLDTMG